MPKTKSASKRASQAKTKEWRPLSKKLIQIFGDSICVRASPRTRKKTR